MRLHQNIINYLSVENNNFVNNENIVTNINSQFNKLGINDDDINDFISDKVYQFEAFNVDHTCWQKAVILEV